MPPKNAPKKTNEMKKAEASGKYNDASARVRKYAGQKGEGMLEFSKAYREQREAADESHRASIAAERGRKTRSAGNAEKNKFVRRK